MIINIPMFVTMVIWRKSSIEVLTNIKPHCGASGGINVDACTHCAYLFFIHIKRVFSKKNRLTCSNWRPSTNRKQVQSTRLRSRIQLTENTSEESSENI